MLTPRHILPFVVPMALITMGSVGSMIEDWPLTDSLDMTVITLSTVGFSEVHPLSEQGRAFTVVLVLGGIFSLFYVATEVIDLFSPSGEMIIEKGSVLIGLGSRPQLDGLEAIAEAREATKV